MDKPPAEHDTGSLYTPFVPPDSRYLQSALESRRRKQPKTVHRTIIMKFHKPSRRKEHAILWAQTHVTNMTAHILEALREDPMLLSAHAPLRTDGALACVLEMLSRKAQGETGDRVTILADVLSACFRAGKKPLLTKPKKNPKIIIKRKPTNVPKLTGADYPLTGPLRDGVFRAVALMLLNWYLRIIGELSEDDQNDAQEGESATGISEESASPPVLAPGEVPDLAHVYSSWASKWFEYSAAVEVIVPFGRQSGKTLKQVGKREARWLRERLIAPKVIEETLFHIAVLLDPLSTGERLRKAKQARHPWRRRVNLHRALRAGPLIQRAFDFPEPLIRLETLNANELRALQVELEEMHTFATEFEHIREAVDVFLKPAPPRYPSVRPIQTAEQLREAKNIHAGALDDLATRLLPIEREAEVVTNLLRAESALDIPEFQPLSFKRTTIPGGATSFALLYSTAEPSRSVLNRKYKRMSKAKRQRKVDEVMAQGPIYTYVLAMVVHGAEAFEGNDPPERFDPEVRPGLFYVNFPKTPFVPPKGASLLLFPLECGETYHELQFLQMIIDAQSRRQEEKFEETRAKPQPGEMVTAEEQTPSKRAKEATLATSYPRAAISSARVTSRRNAAGDWEFYLHLPIEMPTPPIDDTPKMVMGFHEHADGYSYAALDLKGNVINAANMFIPIHVRLKEGDRSYSDNYVFEVANTMVALAQRYAQGESLGALIGLEKNDLRKSNVHLSRAQNWLQFARPSVKLATVLTYKAPLAGLLRPRRTWGVSPNRCSRCGTKRAPGMKNTYPRLLACPSCHSAKLHCSRCGSDRTSGVEGFVAVNEHDDVDKKPALPPANCLVCAEERGIWFDEVQCMDCGSVWRSHEPWFSCEACGHKQPARLNTAIVAAQLTLDQVVLDAQENKGLGQKK